MEQVIQTLKDVIKVILKKMDGVDLVKVEGNEEWKVDRKKELKNDLLEYTTAIQYLKVLE